MPTCIISTLGLGDTYHITYIYIPLGCINLMNSQESTGTYGVVCILPDEEVA